MQRRCRQLNIVRLRWRVEDVTVSMKILTQSTTYACIIPIQLGSPQITPK